MMLDHINSKVVLPKEGNMFNCFGTEFALCLSLFSHVWKIQVKLTCNSPHCPDCYKERYPCSFVLENPSLNNSFLDQLKEQFPRANSRYGAYCAAEFKGRQPPKGSKCALSSRNNVETGMQTTFYECRGQLFAKSACFLAKSPWLLPFRIDSLSPESIMKLPLSVTVFHDKYVLAGFTLHHLGHYTAGLVWRGNKYFYDGLNHRNLVPLRSELIEN